MHAHPSLLSFFRRLADTRQPRRHTTERRLAATGAPLIVGVPLTSTLIFCVTEIRLMCGSKMIMEMMDGRRSQHFGATAAPHRCLHEAKAWSRVRRRSRRFARARVEIAQRSQSRSRLAFYPIVPQAHCLHITQPTDHQQQPPAASNHHGREAARVPVVQAH